MTYARGKRGKNGPLLPAWVWRLGTRHETVPLDGAIFWGHFPE
jgi:hypothetical protein